MKRLTTGYILAVTIVFYLSIHAIPECDAMLLASHIYQWSINLRCSTIRAGICVNIQVIPGIWKYNRDENFQLIHREPNMLCHQSMNDHRPQFERLRSAQIKLLRKSFGMVTNKINITVHKYRHTRIQEARQHVNIHKTKNCMLIGSDPTMTNSQNAVLWNWEETDWGFKKECLRRLGYVELQLIQKACPAIFCVRPTSEIITGIRWIGQYHKNSRSLLYMIWGFIQAKLPALDQSLE